MCHETIRTFEQYASARIQNQLREQAAGGAIT